MKKSEMIVKLTRMYHIRHVMVEGGYITPQQFMEEVLAYVEDLGMSPPGINHNGDGESMDYEWEPENG